MSTIDEAQVRAILSAYAPGRELIRIDQADDGIVNRVFFLTTTGDDLVLRVVEDRSSDWKIQKEAALSAHLRTIGIPAAVVRVSDVSRKWVPVAFSLAERLPGEPRSRVFAALSTA